MVDLASTRKLLEERLAELTAKVMEIRHDLREPADPDFEERASEREEDEVLESLENSHLLEIDQISAAIVRIDEGSYGECISCGESISEGRLSSLPYALQCIECASSSE